MSRNSYKSILTCNNIKLNESVENKFVRKDNSRMFVMYSILMKLIYCDTMVRNVIRVWSVDRIVLIKRRSEN